MSSEHKYSLLIPTYNERDNISLLIYMIDKVLSSNNIDYEIIIVEDNSPDKTIECVREMQKLYGEAKIKVLERPGKLGLGTAYMDGCKLCTGDFIFIMDAAALRISKEPLGLTPGASNPRPNLFAALDIRRILRECNITNGEINIDTIKIEPINHITKTSLLVE